MKRAFLALCLAGLGLFNSGCCSCCQRYDDPQFDPHACGSCNCQSCGGGCGCGHGWHPFRNLFSCTNGCGGRYWGDWFTLQAGCCQTCDNCGNYHGRGAGMPPVGPGYTMQGAPEVMDGTDTIVDDGAAPAYIPSGSRPNRATNSR